MKNEVEIIKNILGEKAVIESRITGGMMNLSFLVDLEGKKFILYISTPEANLMVDRELEKDNQRLISSIGITSKNIYFDTKLGVKINEYIKGSSLDKVSEYEPKKVANLLKRLHTSGIKSSKDYLPFARLIEYKKSAVEVASLSEDYFVIEKALLDNQKWLESQEMTIAHNDAQKSNIVKGEDNHYYLIDFEFVGNNDPIYDIATFGNGSVKEGFEVLQLYFDNHPSIDEQKRYYLWRMFISLQWHLVAIRKHFNGEGAAHGFNFMDVATHFMNNAKEAYSGYLSLIK